jgi:outer membrane protein assembly factor BamA
MLNSLYKILLISCLVLSISGIAKEIDPVRKIRIAADLEISGNQLFSIRQLREKLSAGREVDQDKWQDLLVELANDYSLIGYPFMELQAVKEDNSEKEDSEHAALQISAVKINEGKQLVFGRCRVVNTEIEINPERYFPLGKTVNSAKLQNAFLELLRELENRGRALAGIQILASGLWPLESENQFQFELKLELVDLQEVKPAKVFFSGLTNSRPSTLLKITRLKEGALFNPRLIQDANRRLLASGWFRNVNGPILCLVEGDLALLCEVDELPSYRFDGMAGILPPRENETDYRMSFHFDLDLANILGTGRSLNLLISRPDGISQELSFKYREPFIFNTPLSASILIEQSVQDSTWLKRGFGISADMELLAGLRIIAGAKVEEVFPDSLNGYLLRGLDQRKSKLYFTEFNVDRTDFAANPRSGFKAELKAELIESTPESFKSLPARGLKQSLRRQQSAISVFYPYKNSIVFKAGLKGGLINADNIPLSELFALGGGSNLRGFRERTFLASEYFGGSLEIRYLLGRLSRIALFWDSLDFKQDDIRRRRHGRGIALILPSRLGQLEFQYALGESTKLSNGMIHMRLLSNF